MQRHSMILLYIMRKQVNIMTKSPNSNQIFVIKHSKLSLNLFRRALNNDRVICWPLCHYERTESPHLFTSGVENKNTLRSGNRLGGGQCLSQAGILD